MGDSDELRNKCNQIWNTIVVLETDKYDYEQRQLDQDYEFKELAKRQKLQLRNKAIKKGLDPESFTGKHPPTIHMFSKYERRADTRTYGDRKKLYEGGAEVIRSEMGEAAWKEKFAEWSKRPKARLPKWFGVRPGKKAGDPDTPEGEEDAAAEEDVEEEDYDEEEEEGGGGRGGVNIFLCLKATAILRESNHYRCNFESFHTGHCFYTKLVIACAVTMVSPFIRVLK